LGLRKLGPIFILHLQVYWVNESPNLLLNEIQSLRAYLKTMR